MWEDSRWLWDDNGTFEQDREDSILADLLVSNDYYYIDGEYVPKNSSNKLC